MNVKVIFVTNIFYMSFTRGHVHINPPISYHFLQEWMFETTQQTADQIVMSSRNDKDAPRPNSCSLVVSPEVCVNIRDVSIETIQNQYNLKKKWFHFTNNC